MKIVAVSGWKGSGKDLIANFLINTFGAKRVAFADVLKDMVSEKFGIERSWCDDRDFKEAPILSMPVFTRDEYSRMVNSYLLETFRFADGTKPTNDVLGRFFNLEGDHTPPTIEEINEGIGQLYWTPRGLCILEGSTNRCANPNYWVERAAENLDTGNLYVISDLRFENELNELDRCAPGSVVSVRIDRFDDTTATDASERDLDHYSFKYRINNRVAENKTIQNVYAQMIGIMLKEGYGPIVEGVEL